MTELHAVDWMRVATILLIGKLAWASVRRLTKIVRRVKGGLDQSGIPNPTQRLRLVRAQPRP